MAHTWCKYPGIPTSPRSLLPLISFSHSQDDADILDLPTIKAWALILRLTVAEYLGLDPTISQEDRKAQTRRNNGDLVGS